MAENTRRWKREEAARKRNDTLTTQDGINWTHCNSCSQLLQYTDDPKANPLDSHSQTHLVLALPPRLHDFGLCLQRSKRK